MAGHADQIIELNDDQKGILKEHGIHEDSLWVLFEILNKEEIEQAKQNTDEFRDKIKRLGRLGAHGFDEKAIEKLMHSEYWEESLQDLRAIFMAKNGNEIVQRRSKLHELLDGLDSAMKDTGEADQIEAPFPSDELQSDPEDLNERFTKFTFNKKTFSISHQDSESAIQALNSFVDEIERVRSEKGERADEEEIRRIVENLRIMQVLEAHKANEDIQDVLWQLEIYAGIRESSPKELPPVAVLGNRKTPTPAQQQVENFVQTGATPFSDENFYQPFAFNESATRDAVRDETWGIKDRKGATETLKQLEEGVFVSIRPKVDFSNLEPLTSAEQASGHDGGPIESEISSNFGRKQDEIGTADTLFLGVIPSEAGAIQSATTQPDGTMISAPNPDVPASAEKDSEGVAPDSEQAPNTQTTPDAETKPKEPQQSQPTEAHEKSQPGPQEQTQAKPQLSQEQSPDQTSGPSSAEVPAQVEAQNPPAQEMDWKKKGEEQARKFLKTDKTEEETRLKEIEEGLAKMTEDVQEKIKKGEFGKEKLVQLKAFLAIMIKEHGFKDQNQNRIESALKPLQEEVKKIESGEKIEKEEKPGSKKQPVKTTQLRPVKAYEHLPEWLRPSEEKEVIVEMSKETLQNVKGFREKIKSILKGAHRVGQKLRLKQKINLEESFATLKPFLELTEQEKHRIKDEEKKKINLMKSTLNAIMFVRDRTRDPKISRELSQWLSETLPNAILIQIGLDEKRVRRMSLSEKNNHLKYLNLEQRKDLVRRSFRSAMNLLSSETKKAVLLHLEGQNVIQPTA